MIKGIHGMFYSPIAEELRAFFKYKIGLPCFDAGEGWLIFTFEQGELGFHPADDTRPDVSFYCDDIQATVQDLKSKGVEFTTEIEDHGYGYVTYLKAPGDLIVQLYEKKY